MIKKTERRRTKRGGVGLAAGLIFNRVNDSPARVSDPSPDWGLLVTGRFGLLCTRLSAAEPSGTKVIIHMRFRGRVKEFMGKTETESCEWLSCKHRHRCCREVKLLFVEKKNPSHKRRIYMWRRARNSDITRPKTVTPERGERLLLCHTGSKAFDKSGESSFYFLNWIICKLFNPGTVHSARAAKVTASRARWCTNVNRLNALVCSHARRLAPPASSQRPCNRCREWRGRFFAQSGREWLQIKVFDSVFVFANDLDADFLLMSTFVRLIKRLAGKTNNGERETERTSCCIQWSYFKVYISFFAGASGIRKTSERRGKWSKTFRLNPILAVAATT